jgi:hypothetical protein
MFHTSSNCYCKDNELIRKQREEIVLLTKELQSQDEQLNLIQNLNLKLKAASNLHEIEKTNFESSIKALNNEIKKLKGWLF